MANVEKNINLFGLLLAAGKGERMCGKIKQLLPVGDDTFIGRLIENMLDGGLDDIRVVLGYHKDHIGPKIPDGVDVVMNPKPEEGMLSSILAGLSRPPKGATGALITLVDYPLVAVSTFAELVEAHKEAPGCIISPVFDGKSGHPVVFPKQIFAELAEAPLEVGARHVVRANPDLRKFIPVEDPGIAADINTPEDYGKFIGPFPGG